MNHATPSTTSTEVISLSISGPGNTSHPSRPKRATASLSPSPVVSTPPHTTAPSPNTEPNAAFCGRPDVSTGVHPSAVVYRDTSPDGFKRATKSSADNDAMPAASSTPWLNSTSNVWVASFQRKILPSFLPTRRDEKSSPSIWYSPFSTHLT